MAQESADPQAMLLAARQAWQSGQSDRALSLARALLERQGLPPPYLVPLTELFRRLGDLEAAHEAGQQAVSAVPQAAVERFWILANPLEVKHGTSPKR